MKQYIRTLSVILVPVLFQLSLSKAGIQGISVAMAQSLATDLSIQVSSPEQMLPAPGAFVDFVVKVTNLGTSGNYLPTHVVATLPSEYTEISWSCSGNAPSPVPTATACTGNCHLPACPVPSFGQGNLDVTAGLSANTSLFFMIKARVPENTPNPLILTPTITAPAFATDPNPVNNQSSISLYEGADVSLLMQTSTNPSSGHEGVVFTASVCNAGPYSADGVSAQLNFSKAISLYNTGGPGWTCSMTDQQVFCQLPTLVKNSCSQIQTTVIPDPGVLNASAQGVIALSGRAQDPNSDNNAATLQFTVNRPDRPSLNGGGVGCTMNGSNHATNHAGTLGLFCILSVLLAGYRIARRRQTI